MKKCLFVLLMVFSTAQIHAQGKALLVADKKLKHTMESNKVVYKVNKNKLVKIDCIKSETGLEIVSFDVTVYYPKVLKSMPNKGACFEEHAKTMIYETPTDNKIFIEKIKAKNASGIVHTLPAIVIQLVP